ncbi:hypothetical protein [Gemella sp.]
MGKIATINVRVDEEDKRSTELLLKQVSLNKNHPFNGSLSVSPHTANIENMTSEEFGKMMIQEYQNAEGDNVRPVDEFFNEFRMKFDGQN